ncbi:MAG: hypothetical protein SF053_12970 [Bacteroidia bacterium]|nr:hypothetical protein [Bacteroidia bacterium]
MTPVFRLMVLIVCLLGTTSLQAQLYAGTAPVQISSEGTARTTLLKSEQLSGRFVPETGRFMLLVKTGSFAVGAGPAETGILNRVFLPQQNALLVLEADLASLALQPGQSREVTIPVQVTFNSTTQLLEANLRLKLETETLTFSLELPATLEAFKLSRPEADQADFGTEILISVDNASFTRR